MEKWNLNNEVVHGNNENMILEAGWGHVCMYIDTIDDVNKSDDLICWGFNR